MIRYLSVVLFASIFLSLPSWAFQGASQFSRQSGRMLVKQSRNFDRNFGTNSGQRFTPIKLERSTTENFKLDKPYFYGKYIAERRQMDYKYYRNYNLERQLEQDQIIDKCVALPKVKFDGCLEFCTSQRTKNKLILSCGPMGVGKSTVLRQLEAVRHIEVQQPIWLDSDLIKIDVPEYEEYHRFDLPTAATQLHEESAFLQELAFRHSLTLSRDIISDQSMRNVEFMEAFLTYVRREFPGYDLELICVTGNRDEIFERAKRRAQEVGRHVPDYHIEDSIRRCPEAAKKLNYLFNRVRVYDNRDGKSPELISETTNKFE